MVTFMGVLLVTNVVFLLVFAGVKLDQETWVGAQILAQVLAVAIYFLIRGIFSEKKQGSENN